MIENKIPAGDNLLEDTFQVGESLADIFVREVHRVYDEPAAEVGINRDSTEPIRVYAPPPTDSFRVISDPWFADEYGLWVLPESFHYMGESAPQNHQERAAAIINTANEHYQKLREFGMKVVGHTFEAADSQDQRLTTHPQFPTVFVAAKYATAMRTSDRLDNNDSDYQTSVAVPLAKPYVKVCKLTRANIMETIIEPLREYTDWCETSEQEYMLTGLHGLTSYRYHLKTGAIVLQSITSRMNAFEYIGHHWAKQKIEGFTKAVTEVTN